MALVRRRRHIREGADGRAIVVRAHDVVVERAGPPPDPEAIERLRRQAALDGLVGPALDPDLGRQIPADYRLATGMSADVDPERWWLAAGAGSEGAGVPRMPERLGEGGRRVHRSVYGEGDLRVRMPSQAAIARYLGDRPDMAVVDIPAEVFVDGRLGLGAVRLSKDVDTGAWRAIGGDGAFEGDDAWARHGREAVTAVVQARRPRAALDRLRAAAAEAERRLGTAGAARGETTTRPSAMTWSEVRSSALDRVGYDPASRRMEVVFPSGSRAVYRNVPPEVHRGLMEAPSVGSHYVAHIRGNPAYLRAGERAAVRAQSEARELAEPRLVPGHMTDRVEWVQDPADPANGTVVVTSAGRQRFAIRGQVGREEFRSMVRSTNGMTQYRALLERGYQSAPGRGQGTQHCPGCGRYVGDGAGHSCEATQPPVDTAPALRLVARPGPVGHLDLAGEDDEGGEDDGDPLAGWVAARPPAQLVGEGGPARLSGVEALDLDGRSGLREVVLRASDSDGVPSQAPRLGAAAISSGGRLRQAPLSCFREWEAMRGTATNSLTTGPFGTGNADLALAVLDRTVPVSRHGVEMLPMASTALARAGYNPATRRLRVEMHDGRGYTYEGVPPEAWTALREAPSPGRAYGQTVARQYPVVGDPDVGVGASGRLRRLPIPSDVVHAAGYDAESAEMAVQLADGTVYRYGNVPRSLYAELVGSDIPGRVFAQKVRGQFRGRKDAVRRGPVGAEPAGCRACGQATADPVAHRCGGPADSPGGWRFPRPGEAYMEPGDGHPAAHASASRRVRSARWLDGEAHIVDRDGRDWVFTRVDRPEFNRMVVDPDVTFEAWRAGWRFSGRSDGGGS